MGYYHPFPEAIPLSKAGCSRVTHPSATNLKEQAPSRPFDLHVLGVPPAFVLSQDQTLYEVCILKPFGFIIILSSLRLLAITSFNSCFFFQRNLQGFVLKKALFNFQDTFYSCHSLFVCYFHLTALLLYHAITFVSTLFSDFFLVCLYSTVYQPSGLNLY